MTPRALLIPSTKRLKELIHIHGPTWKVIRVAHMPCFKGALGAHISSIDGKHQRNILIEDLERFDE